MFILDASKFACVVILPVTSSSYTEYPPPDMGRSNSSLWSEPPQRLLSSTLPCIHTTDGSTVDTLHIALAWSISVHFCSVKAALAESPYSTHGQYDAKQLMSSLAQVCTFAINLLNLFAKMPVKSKIFYSKKLLSMNVCGRMSILYSGFLRTLGTRRGLLHPSRETVTW